MILIMKCPSCGSSMRFAPEKSSLVCDSCKTEKTVEERAPAAQKAWEEETTVYNCSSCGAQLVAEQHTSATFCGYCGQPTIIPSRLTGVYAPSLVIPFKISRKKADDAFRKWSKRGLITPSGLVQAQRSRKLSGLYVPFWLYDCDISGDFQAQGTKVRVYRVGDTEFTETSIFSIQRSLDALYRKVPTDASTRMEDDQMDKLEPFDSQELTEFQMPYLSGFLAEKYDLDSQELFPRLTGRVNQYLKEYVRSTMSGYSTVTFRQEDIRYDRVQADYAMLPVWMLSFKYRKKEYVFAMNGETGKVVGKPPISIPKVLLWFFGIAAGLFGLLNLLEVIFL